MRGHRIMLDFNIAIAVEDKHLTNYSLQLTLTDAE